MIATPDRLTFDADAHIYRLDGGIVPSVTQVLEDVRISDYSSIPYDTRVAALARGTRVHVATAYDDEFVSGMNNEPLDDDTVAEGDKPYLEAWRAFRRNFDFRSAKIEHRSYHRTYRYAGTLDRIGYFGGDPRRQYVVDLKTGTAEWWVRVQLAAYAAMFDDPRMYHRLCVELHKDGTYNMYSFGAESYKRDFDIFLYALAIYSAKRNVRKTP